MFWKFDLITMDFLTIIGTNIYSYWNFWRHMDVTHFISAPTRIRCKFL